MMIALSNSGGEVLQDLGAPAREVQVVTVEAARFGWLVVPESREGAEPVSFNIRFAAGAGTELSTASSGCWPGSDEESLALAADVDLLQTLADGEADIANGDTIPGSEFRQRD